MGGWSANLPLPVSQGRVAGYVGVASIALTEIPPRVHKWLLESQNEISFAARMTARLLRAQSVSGIGSGCAQSGKRRSKKRQGQHETDACCVDDRIRGADSEQESADESRDGERSKKTESAAGGCDFRARAEHKPRDVAALCAQGHADGDLLRALRDAEGNDSVDAHGCQEQGGEREGRDQARIEAARALHR
jgi:hypothetical protein